MTWFTQYDLDSDVANLDNPNETKWVSVARKIRQIK